jgi:hypothetical protein
MRTPREYRNYAEQCRALARSAATPEQRALLRRMAATWDDLANEREVTTTHAVRKR